MSKDSVITDAFLPRKHEVYGARIRKRNLFLSSLLNFISPGLGYYYCGLFKPAIIFALLWPITFLIVDYFSLFFPAGANSVFYLTTHFLLVIIPIVHVTFIANKRKKYEIVFLNKIKFYILFLCLASLYSYYISNSFVVLHRVPAPSMENTLMIDDRFIAKYDYGIYNPFTDTKIFNFRTPKRNEIVIYSTMSKLKNSLFMKRIIGVPRDTISIVEKEVFINGISENKFASYKYEGSEIEKDYYNVRIYPVGKKWNEDFYGPLYIPAKGDVIKLTDENFIFWKPVILKEKENSEGSDSYLAEIKSKGEYVIQNNYYFMLGDNRENSLDSRFNGLVAENEILGRAEYIVFNPDFLDRFGTMLR